MLLSHLILMYGKKILSFALCDSFLHVVTGSTYEGGEEVDDESEDYFDGDTYDDVDEEELMTILGWK